MPEYAEVHSQVLQDVLARGSRLPSILPPDQAGETLGYPRFQGGTATQIHVPAVWQRRTLDNGFLVLSKIGRIALRWTSPTGGHTQDGHGLAGGGRLVCRFSCADVPMQPLAATDRRQASTWG